MSYTKRKSGDPRKNIRDLFFQRFSGAFTHSMGTADGLDLMEKVYKFWIEYALHTSQDNAQK